MNKQITDKIYCILLRSGIRIWVDKLKSIELTAQIRGGGNLFEIEGQVVNKSDISGIFTADKIDELDKEKRGMWKCKFNVWHNRYDICNCGMIPKELR